MKWWLHPWSRLSPPHHLPLWLGLQRSEGCPKGITGTTPPVGMARPIANDLVWPGHPTIWGSNLFRTLDEGQDVQEDTKDSEEWWILLHPYEQRGMLNPTAGTPGNIRRIAENEELVESIQVMEHLTDLPPMGSRRDYRCYPLRYGDPYYQCSGTWPWHPAPSTHDWTRRDWQEMGVIPTLLQVLTLFLGLVATWPPFDESSTPRKKERMWPHKLATWVED